VGGAGALAVNPHPSKETKITESAAVALRCQIAFTSPERSDQIACRRAEGARDGRPPAFDPDLYAGRNVRADRVTPR